MTITPQQAMNEIRTGDRRDIKLLEEKIDGVIRKDFDGEGKRAVIVDTAYVRPRLVTEIKHIYGEAGWDIKYCSDQRDGEWFELRPKRGHKSK